MFFNLFLHELKSSSFCASLENCYVEKVKHLVGFLQKNQWNFLTGIVATFLIEPHQAFRAAYLMHKGLDGKNITTLNPKYLSKEQLKYTPVLFIHGDFSSSGIFEPMINRLAYDFPHRPLFTIDLISPDGIVSEKQHLKSLISKVKEIATLYASATTPKISFIGHSSGGDVIGPVVKVMMSEKELPQPGTIIKIGSIFKKMEAEQFTQYSHGSVLEIVGTKDVFEGSQSHLSNQFLVVAGHLGLLFNQKVLNRVSSEINN